MKIEQIEGMIVDKWTKELAERVDGFILGEKMKIFLGVPSGTGLMAIETVKSIVALEGITNVAFVANALVYDARNQIVEEFLKSDCDYLMWLDDDMVVEPDTATKLIQAAEEHKLDLVTAMIFRRTPPYTPCFYGKIEYINGHPVLYPCAEWEDNVLIPIRACGLAACVVKRSAIYSLVQINKKAFKPNGSVGEDMQFCLDLDELGGKFACFTGVDTGHIEHRAISSKHWKEFYATHKEEEE